MKTKLLTILTATCLGGALAQAQISEDLVAYWPLDEVRGSKTPDRISGYDMELNNLSEEDLVEGHRGRAFSFSNEQQTLLSRVHTPGEDLPANQHESYTISMWTMVQGTGQNDLRVFSEANTENSNPLFNIGTDNGGANGVVDFYFRQDGWDTVNHIKSEQEPFDGSWHHIVFVQENGERRLYVDTQLDSLEIPPKPEGEWQINNTTIGGILRSSASHWVTGLIDEVMIWKRALSDDEIQQVNDEGLESLFPPLADGLISHWPLDEVQGSRTPDLISNYDMDLTNLTADDLVPGQNGNAFSFSNADQTLLSRVHNPNDQLPVNQHESYTISMWTMVEGNGQNDLRVFSEGNTDNSNPLFNIGTDNTGATGAVDLFFRQDGWDTVGHIHSVQEPFDGSWHHIAFVQENGERSLYIDGVLDDLEIPAKPEGDWLVNNTSIGGILRSSASHWVTGLIDDVAIWRRALAPDELQQVIDEGVPEVFSQPQPLEIRSFTSDFPAVAAGDAVVLRWDATDDATLSINNDVGDVTGVSEFGSGTLEVAVEESTTFILTAERDGESVSAQVTVDAVTGVAENWRLLDNFDTYTSGPVTGNGHWKNPVGTAVLYDLGENVVLTFQGQALNALELKSLTLEEGEEATVFFRFVPSNEDVSSPIGINFGLTEAPLRFVGDFTDNIGPYARIEKFDAQSPIEVLARNGVGAGYDIADFTLEHGQIYNIWLDVVNRSVEEGDLYSLHIQEEGSAGRTTVFEDYVGDRNPEGSQDLGAPTPNLVLLLLSAINDSVSGQGSESMWFDDLYISGDGLNDTVPVAPSSFEIILTPPTGGDHPDVVLTGEMAEGGFLLSWNSQEGTSYNIQHATDFNQWNMLAEDYPADGDTTTYLDASAGDGHRYYRIAFQPGPGGLFYEDFESGAPGWTTSDISANGTVWELGQPENGPESAVSGQNVYGTDLDGIYNDFTEIALTSPPIDLTGVDGAAVQFFHFTDMEGLIEGQWFDYGEINILDGNGNPFTDADGSPLYQALWQQGGVTPDWRTVRVALPDGVMGEEIRIEFKFYSDNFFDPDIGANQDGWYIDDVIVLPE